MFKGKLIELPQLEHPPLIYETTLLLMIICLFIFYFFYPTNLIKNKETGNIIQMCQKKNKKKESKESQFWSPQLDEKNLKCKNKM